MNQTNSLFAAAAVLLLASEASACPSYDVSVSQASGISYSPVDNTNAPVVLQISAIGAPLAPECVDVPVVIEGDSSGPQPLLFVDVSGTRLLGDFVSGPDTTRVMSTLTLTADARSRLVQGLPVNVQIGEIPAGQFLRAGIYAATIRVSAGGAGSSDMLNAIVEPAFLLQLSSADGVEEVLLNGDPQTGTSGSTVFFYRTNTDLRVSAASLNGGALVHERGADVGRIPYNAALDGNPLNLASGTAQVDFGFSNPNLQSRTITVDVPPAGPLIAGRYEDVITFSFAPY